MNKFSEESVAEIREVVRDEIAILGWPAGLTVLIRALMIIVRWAQKTRKGMQGDKRL